MILVSACLVGEKCKYSGASNDSPAVRRFLEGRDYIAFCPELLGGLGVPRPPVELDENGAAWNRDGENVSQAFALGAQRSLRLCEEYQPELLILKDGSPSCGVNYIYDGSFSHQTIPGLGLTARLLREHGYALISEADLEDPTGATETKL
ncbi:MAG: DUF523 domain-containing protein [Clostridia bacterium]|nr:DUF523 domain-containing protein [Clostridia bacterium]